MTSSVMYVAVYKCPNKSVQEHHVVFQTIHLSISNHPRDLVLLMANVSRVCYIDRDAQGCQGMDL